MLVEVKAKVSWIIDTKIRKKPETYIADCEFFSQAEYAVTALLNVYKEEGTVDSFEITAIQISAVKEIITQYQGENSFIATLRDTIILDDGSEKQIRYKVLLWADNINEAMTHTREIVSQGYNMKIDGLKEVNYKYIPTENHEDSGEENQ